MTETTEQKCESSACSSLACPLCEVARRFPQLLRAALLVFAAVVLAAVVNQLNPRGISWAISPGGRVGIPRTFVDRLPEVGAKVALGMLQSGDFTFLDSRDAKDFAEDRIPGAVNLPMRDWAKVWPTMQGKLPRDRKYLLYCYGGKCGLSTRQAKRLLEEGYAHVTVLEYGWEEWTEAGYPTVQRPEGSAK